MQEQCGLSGIHAQPTLKVMIIYSGCSVLGQQHLHLLWYYRSFGLCVRGEGHEQARLGNPLVSSGGFLGKEISDFV